MCRSCGAIVGAGQTQCGVCGASTVAQPTSDPNYRPADKETIRFARAVLSRPYKFTIVFLVLNLFVFLLMWGSSGLSVTALVRGFPDPVLIVYGAQLNYLIKAPNHQWWRLITPMFVHIDLLHLAMNMFSLLILGPFVEKLYGSAKFVVFWIVSGLAGSVAIYLALRPSLARGILGSFIFKAVDVPAAGASGALFGLVGVLFVFGIKYRRELPEGFKRVFGTGLLPIIFINLFIGFVGRSFIGNAAHLGGLFTGAALALFIDYRRPGTRSGINVAWRVLQVLSLAVIALGAYKIARNFERPLPALVRVNQTASSAVFLNYVNAMNKVQEKAAAVIHKNDLSDLESVTQQALQAPVPDARAAELRSRLLVILLKLAGTAASPSPQKPAGQPPQLDQKLIDDFDEWRKEYNEWLKGAVKIYTS
ncbi:MAG TPA: rhomboid family intramembrane serine protease [Pyrinomonadaceae bacterium]|jgi:rhomboid protease GluP|nr:rhomboid family intramembrane serine protease [Pyrinomonadaceae bacterium]